MLSPVLVTPPAVFPVSLIETKAHLPVDFDDDDALITGLIHAAVSHLDGYTGILGRALVEQVWRQDFSCFGRVMRLALGPVIEIQSITWRDRSGQISTIGSANYALRTDSIGPYVYWDDGYAWPSALYENAAISVTYKAGYLTIPADGATPAISTVPPAIKVAIHLLVASWYHSREAHTDGIISEVPFSVNALLAPFRRLRL